MSSINSSTTSNVPNQATNSVDLSQFHSGATAQCIVALLELQSKLAEISNLYGQQVMSQLEASNAVAYGLAEVEKKIGLDQMIGSLTAGVGGMLSGVASGVGLLTNPAGCAAEKAPIEEKLNNTLKYREALEVRSGEQIIGDQAHVSTENQETITKLTKQTKFDKTISTEEKEAINTSKSDERERISKNVEKDIKRQEKELEKIQARDDQSFNKWSQLTNVGATAFRSAGDLGQGSMQNALGKDNAEKTYENNALSQIQSAVGEAAKHSDEYVGSAQQVSQILTDINRSNQMN